jgi:uncharacterized protein (TIGR02270 family)
MPRLIAEIVDQHAEEAAFLWLLRDAAVSAPHYTLADLANLDQRVEAHLDGLRLAGEGGWETAIREARTHRQPGEVFAAALLALESGDSERVAGVVELAGVAASPPNARALSSALGWLAPDRAVAAIRPFLSAAEPALKRIGLAAAALHRRNPGASVLVEACAADDPYLKARALRALGELGLADLHLNARAGLKARDPACRFWAAWSAALLSTHRDAIAALRQAAESPGPFAERAARLAVRCLPLAEARLWIRQLVKQDNRTRAAIKAAGALGDPAFIPWLIDRMKEPSLARVCGEALSLITGVHIAYDGLEGTPPVVFEPGPSEDPQDDDVALDPDEGLAWPDPGLALAWWQSQRSGFPADSRLLAGRPISRDNLRDLLRSPGLVQRARAAAAIELALASPGRPLFEVRAPGFRQLHAG